MPYPPTEPPKASERILAKLDQNEERRVNDDLERQAEILELRTQVHDVKSRMKTRLFAEAKGEAPEFQIGHVKRILPSGDYTFRAQASFDGGIEYVGVGPESGVITIVHGQVLGAVLDLR